MNVMGHVTHVVKHSLLIKNFNVPDVKIASPVLHPNVVVLVQSRKWYCCESPVNNWCLQNLEFSVLNFVFQVRC